MKISGVLIFVTFLLVSFVNARAQCNAISQELLQEPAGIFPNEMEGFKFFGEGKLSSLRLGISTREDVAKILGKPVKIINNEEIFEGDPDWTIIVYYFDQKYSAISRYSLNNSIPRLWLPAPEYIGKMSFVQLSKKKKISFNQMPNPDKFTKQSYDDKFNFTVYRDNYGLSYTVSDRVSDKEVESQDSPSKGDILNITYHIECSIQRKFFIERKPLTEERDRMAKKSGMRF